MNLNYVSIVDYRQMAIESVARCRLLADVVGSSSAVRDALREKDVEYVVDDPQYREKLGAWSLALGEILDKAEQSLMGMSKDEFIDVFKEVMEVNASTIALPEPVLIAQFTDAAFSALDPYTTLIWPRQVEEFEKIMTNEFTGIGIEITKEKGLLTVASLLPDTPAYNSGLDAEDIIEAVDGVPTKDMSLMCAVRNITGPAGTKVTLTIRSAGEEQSRDITITRARITVPTIRGWLRDEIGGWLYMLDEANKIGYVRVTSFSERTSSDLDKVLGQLESEGLRGLILDLRFNTGGLLPSAVAVTNKFLEEGPIVVTRPRSWVLSSYESAHKKGTHPDYPLVILINRYSASASEIVAGALADEIHERAVLVGDRTHGKGSVQVLTTYPKEGAQLRYTMAYYHLPSGQRVESREAMEKQGRSDWGIGPDIEIKLRRDEHLKRRVVQRANDILVKAGHDNDIAPLKRYTVEEVFEADPQLAVGVLVVKAKDIERRVKNYN